MYSIKPLGGKGPLPVIVIIVAIVLVLVVLPLFAMNARDAPAVDNAKLVLIPQVKNNDRQAEVSLNNATLYVPDGATDLTGSFVLSPLLPDSFSFASEPDWHRPIVVDIKYHNAEGVPYHGVTFSQPIRVCFTLTQDRWSDFAQVPDDFQVQYLDDAEAPFHWMSMPLSMDSERNQLCTETDHLSVYALAVRVKEEIPVTGPTFTATPAPSNTLTTVVNTPESRRDRNQDDESPVSAPPTILPPMKQPTQAPPPTDALVTEPPATDPPATEPPATEPPATEPPVTEPPATDPPVTEPPPANTEPPPA